MCRTLLRDLSTCTISEPTCPGIRNFQVNTHGCTVDEAAWQVVEKAGWGSAAWQDK